MKIQEGKVVGWGCQFSLVLFFHNHTVFNSWHSCCPPFSLLGCYTLSTGTKFFINSTIMCQSKVRDILKTFGLLFLFIWRQLLYLKFTTRQLLIIKWRRRKLPWPNLRYCLGTCLEKVKKASIIFSQTSQCPGGDSNRANSPKNPQANLLPSWY
jgi:hypothetical protein